MSKPGLVGFEVTQVDPQEALAMALASVRLSGLSVSEEHLEILRKAASGEFSFDTAKLMILKSIGKEPGTWSKESNPTTMLPGEEIDKSNS